MAVGASGVAAELRRRLPRIADPTLHHLLYYCQGHHLAATGEPLYEEALSAWDQGPVVGYLWRLEADPPPPRVRPGFLTRTQPAPEPEPLTDEHLATVEAVLRRYAILSPRDLRNLTRAEDPWRRADVGREPGGSARISWSWLLDYFRLDDDEAAIAQPGLPSEPQPVELQQVEPQRDVAGAVRVAASDATDHSVVQRWRGTTPPGTPQEYAVSETSTPGSAA